VNVKVKFFTTLREITGKKEEQYVLQGAATVGDLIQSLVKTYGHQLRNYLFEGDQLRPQFQILVDGRAVEPSVALNTQLQDGATVAILPPAGGG